VRGLVLIPGIQAAGKSTVAQLVAEALPRSVHVPGDVFRRMVVGGRADMVPDPPAEALRQLRLRYRLAAMVADEYCAAGFTTILQDVILGPALDEMINLIKTTPLYVVVLAPRPDVVAAREAARGTSAYDDWSVRMLDDSLRTETPRAGLWLDTSEQTPAETAAEIVRGVWTEGAIGQ
jgi:chloramphenicol 3-O-phosphotransferase